MTIYRDTNVNVYLEHPHAGPLNAVVTRNGDTILTLSNIAKVGGKFTVPLTYVHTAYDASLTIRWTAAGFERLTTVKVVTPIAPLDKLRELLPSTATDEIVENLERAVRVLIEAYTGQSFGYFIGTYLVRGSGSIIELPQRLVRLDRFSTNDVTIENTNFDLNSSGWYIENAYPDYLTIKMAPPEEFMDNIRNGLIHIPDWYRRSYSRNVLYAVEGIWGYTEIPEDVREAALLLASDLSCNEAAYRDKYLQTIKFANSTFTFNNQAFDGTGNARADFILEKYKRNGMMVV